jgi:hypothetical protein
MADVDYKIYIQRVDIDNQPIYDLESHWSEIRYKQCKGLNDKGKKKSIYTESYADSDDLRVYEDATLSREATSIELTLYFMGANKQGAYDSFYDYVKKGTFLYADTVRRKLAKMILIDPVKPDEEKFTQGDTSYYKVKFTFQNIWGECKDATEFIEEAEG